MEKQENNESELNGSNLDILLGDYLKQKRIDKNCSLEKLSQKTKISINILKALEANDFDHLPSAAYIKGFVTSYVKVLGIPLNEAIVKMEYTYLNILGKSFPALNHTKTMISSNINVMDNKSNIHEENATPHDVIESGDSILKSTKSILPIIVFGLVILVFVGGYKIIASIVEGEVQTEKEKDLGPKIESSSALVKQPVKPDEKKEEVSSTGATTGATTSPTTASPEVAKSAEVLQRSFPTVEFKKIRSKLFNVISDAPENSDETILPKTVRDAMNSSLQNIYIKATEGNTWLSYKIDNNPIESVIINKGNDLILQGEEIRIFLGNVNVTKIFYNNYLIETPTKNGVKSLVFPEESNVKFQLPLFPKAKDDILYTAEDYFKRMKLEEEEAIKRKEDL